MLGTKNGVTPTGNEYFRNDAEGQNKAAEWVGYTLPVPLHRIRPYHEKIILLISFFKH